MQAAVELSDVDVDQDARTQTIPVATSGQSAAFVPVHGLLKCELLLRSCV